MNIGIHRKQGQEPIKLSTLKHGDLFRWQGTTFEECIVGSNDASFFMVINLPGKEADRVSVVSLDGKTVLVRDGSHLVYKEEGGTLSFDRLVEK